MVDDHCVSLAEACVFLCRIEIRRAYWGWSLDVRTATRSTPFRKSVLLREGDNRLLALTALSIVPAIPSSTKRVSRQAQTPASAGSCVDGGGLALCTIATEVAFCFKLTRRHYPSFVNGFCTHLRHDFPYYSFASRTGQSPETENEGFSRLGITDRN